MSRIYFVVEGPHDVEVVGRCLALRQFKRISDFDALDTYWHPLVPRSFPIGGDLQRRVPVPVFFSSADCTVAVHSAGGVTRIGDVIQASFAGLDTPPDALGVVLDADYKQPADRVWSEVVLTLPLKSAGATPGAVSQGPPRAGVFVFPDNNSQGTVEDVLLQCAERAYPKLLQSAREWIDQIDPLDKTIFVNRKESEDFVKPAGKAKAIAGSIASILRPGKALQVSIQDNQWLKNEEALAHPLVTRFQAFVDEILGTSCVPR